MALTGCAVVLLAAAIASTDRVIITRQQAQVAADLGALAGAQVAPAGERVSCARVAVLVSANHGSLVGCRLDGLDLAVTVSIDVAAGPIRAGPVLASARAGPLRVEPVVPEPPPWSGR